MVSKRKRRSKPVAAAKAKRRSSLPRAVFEKHGRYYLVRQGKWHALSKVADGIPALYAAIGNMEQVLASKLGAKPPRAPGDVLGLVTAYIAQGTGELRSATVRGYSALAKGAAFVKRWKGQPLSSLKSSDIARWLHEERLRGAGTTANRAVALISSAHRWGLVAGYTDSNPVLGVARNREKPANKWATREKIMGFVAYAPLPTAILCELAWITGARASALVAMDLAGVTDEGLRWTETKTGKAFLAKWNADLLRVVGQARDLKRKPGVTALLVTARQHPWDMNRIALALKRGGAGFSFRDIRKGAAIHAATVGSNLLGHKQQMLGVYLREETVTPNPL